MIFLGCLFDREKENEIFKNSKIGLSNAVNTYQWNLIDGLNQNMPKPVSIINVLPVGTYPKYYKKILLKTKKWSYMNSENTELGSINLPFFKQFFRTVKLKKMLRQQKDKNIIIYSAYMPFLKAVQRLDNSYNITLIVTDLPQFYDLAKTNHIRKLLRYINSKIVYKCLKRVDSFVVLTEQMKKPLHIGLRNYTIVEGLSQDIPTYEKSTTDKKIILYTGSLNYKFGIKTLLEAFSQIQNSNYELWICGSGEAAKEIAALQKEDSRIKFFGYVTKEKIYKLQCEATVLINPRTNNGEYTKYSFPSKTMEYLASGTPVLMYKLSGIPPEYDNYLNYIIGNTAKDLKDSILSLCEKSPYELHTFGQAAKEWVLKEKNNVVQAKKILDMINNTEKN